MSVEVVLNGVWVDGPHPTKCCVIEPLGLEAFLFQKRLPKGIERREQRPQGRAGQELALERDPLEGLDHCPSLPGIAFATQNLQTKPDPQRHLCSWR